MGKTGKAANGADRKTMLSHVRRLVVKLGTGVVTVHDHRVNRKVIGRLAEDLARLRRRGVRAAVVTSGAIGAGMGRLGVNRRPTKIRELQASAAVGQGLLMNAYNRAFGEHGLSIGQVLLTSDDLDDRKRYVNARNTLDALFRFGAVPVINENDSVAVEEIKVGDNDRLSALVAHLIDADLLIVLTDVDGLYSDDPTRSGDAELIRQVGEVTPDMVSRAGKAGSPVSLGGMRTKLQAALSVTRGGRMMVIANGHTTGIADILAGRPVGTLFLQRAGRLPGRKLWIADSRRKGTVVVDDGAVEAIWSRGKSLLPSGIVGVVGDFEAGDLIGVVDRAETEVARGLVRYGAGEIRKILG